MVAYMLATQKSDRTRVISSSELETGMLASSNDLLRLYIIPMNPGTQARILNSVNARL